MTCTVAPHNSTASTSPPRRVPSRVRGVGLVEVMVALVVLSIGLLGVANLQLSGLRMTQEAYFHSQAAVLAQDIIDRMRANPAAVASDAYLRDSFADEKKVPRCAPVSLDGNVADQDLALWTQRLACALPAGDGTVVRRNDGVMRITVRWRTREDGEDAFATETTEVQL